LKIAEHRRFGELSSAKLVATRPERRKSSARQKILLSRAKIAFQSTAFWAIHPEARVLVRHVGETRIHGLR
jgi:hypothetical protein